MKIKVKIFLIYLISIILFAGAVYLLYAFDILSINFEKNISLLITSLSLIFILPLIFVIYISSDISNSSKQVKSLLSHFFSDKKTGEKLRKKSERKDEFGNIFKELSELYSSYESYRHFAENLKKGNLKIESNFIKNEPLAVAMIDIKENLITAEKERKYNLKESEQNKWYQTGVTDFTLLLQQDFRSTEEMAYPVIKKLAEHLKVEQAGIFILKKKEEKDILILEAAYAYDKKKQLDTEVEIGESLVGKCAKEQKLIRIDDLPEGYTYISSGLGEDTPKSLILMPLLYEKKLFGVLEIASLKRISDYRINFLNVIAERIAAEISNINSKILTAKLAEDYKKQSEELEIKEQKSAEKIAELAQEKEALINEQKNLSAKTNLIDKAIPLVILNSEGIISDINEAAEELYNVKKDAVLKKDIKTVFSKDDKFSEILKKVSEGETMISRISRNNKTEELIEKYVPVKNNDNKITSIILTTVLTKKQ